MPNDDNGDVRPLEPLWPLPLPLAQAKVGIGDSSTPRKPANCCENAHPTPSPREITGRESSNQNEWLPGMDSNHELDKFLHVTVTY